MAAPQLGDALPAWAEGVFLDEAVWQWLALGLTLALFAGTMIACYIWANRWDKRGPGGISQIGKILFVVALIGLTRLLAAFVEDGINISGRTLVIVALVLDVIAFAAGGWLIALVLTLIGETIIRAQRLRQGAINSQLIRICFRLLTIVVLLYLAIAAAEAFGVPVAPLIASLGVGGLAIALAVRPTLENVLGGFTLFADKPVRVGDFCLYGDKLGTVEEIGLRSTRIRSLERTVVTVPNAEFSQMQLENFTRRDQMLFRTTLGLRYETTPEQLRYVLAKLRELLIAHPMVSPDPARVRFAGFGTYSLDIEIFAYVQSRRLQRLYGRARGPESADHGHRRGSGHRLCLPLADHLSDPRQGARRRARQGGRRPGRGLAIARRSAVPGTGSAAPSGAGRQPGLSAQGLGEPASGGRPTLRAGNGAQAQALAGGGVRRRLKHTPPITLGQRMP